jgi:hypothetical protein
MEAITIELLSTPAFIEREDSEKGADEIFEEERGRL